MGLGSSGSPLGYASFDVAIMLYELSGWPGDVDWAEWLPISKENHPGYTCGYLFQQLKGVIPGFDISINPHSPHYHIRYWDLRPLPPPGTPYAASHLNYDPGVDALGDTAEDALTHFCIELWERGIFL